MVRTGGGEAVWLLCATAHIAALACGLRLARVAEPAEHRCDTKKDCGTTRADRAGSQIGYYCVHFARGACCNGADCQYYHRIPTAAYDA